jgi:hypothetical protein
MKRIRDTNIDGLRFRGNLGEVKRDEVVTVVSVNGIVGLGDLMGKSIIREVFDNLKTLFSSPLDDEYNYHFRKIVSSKK